MTKLEKTTFRLFVDVHVREVRRPFTNLVSGDRYCTYIGTHLPTYLQCDQIWQNMYLWSLAFSWGFNIWKNFYPTRANFELFCGHFHCRKWPNIELMVWPTGHSAYLSPFLPKLLSLSSSLLEEWAEGSYQLNCTQLWIFSPLKCLCSILLFYKHDSLPLEPIQAFITFY